MVAAATKPRRLLVTAREARALLAGATQVRRLVTPQPLGVESREALVRRLPLVVGGVYWIAEAHAVLLAVSPATDAPLEITDGERLIEPPTSWRDGRGVTRWNYDGKVIAYRVNSEIEFCDGDGFRGDRANREDMPRWRSAATMPAWASRMSIVVETVRVERVQDATEADARAMGVQHDIDCDPDEQPLLTLLRIDWDAEHPRAPWAANPWVAVGTVRRVEG